MKRIVLCADDYGQAPAISNGIIQLIQAKRLSATSCMVNGDDWEAQGAALLPYRNQVDIGLHFNLTHGRALSTSYAKMHEPQFQSLSTVLRRAFLYQFDVKTIAAELHSQLDLFEKKLGFAPDFIDGHQHIHHFPVIREALLSVYRERFSDKKTYVRLVKMPMKFTDFFKNFRENFKKIIIFLTGVSALKRALDTENIPHNIDFNGIYSFDQAESMSLIFPKFLQEISDRGLIMCHPGLHSDDARDPISASRFHEFQYFFSEKFLADCQRADVVLTRFSAL